MLAETDVPFWSAVGSVMVAVIYGMIVAHERWVRPWIQKKNMESGKSSEMIAIEAALNRIQDRACPIDRAQIQATHTVSRETLKAVGDLAASVNKLAAITIEQHRIQKAVHEEREKIQKMRHDQLVDEVRRQAG